MSKTVAVIDYGMGNLHSVESALCKAGADRVFVTDKPDAILNADRVVFPGVGAIRDCIGEFKRLGCDETLKTAIQVGTPVLGICVGMQSLMTRSEENGGVACLAWLQGPVTRCPQDHRDLAGTKLKVPHMGWNECEHTNHPMFKDIESNAHLYFVHSYHVKTTDPAIITATTTYETPFVSAVAKGTLWGTQFHPEKSSRVGLKLLKNFLELTS